jgi:hypothetical protein
MKSKFYLILSGLCFSLMLSAQNFQNYTSVIMSDWVNGNWKNSTRISNTFDSKGNIIKTTSDDWNTNTNAWVNYSVVTHELNANSTINYSITQTWNDETNQLETTSKEIYTYDDSKRILTNKMQMLLETQWIDMYLTTNTYNGSGQLLSTVFQMLDFLSMQMVNSSRSTYTYNPDGTENQNIDQDWNSLTGEWENTGRYTSTYNNAKQVVAYLNEEFTNGAWINSNKSIISYNADGTYKESLYQNWNVSGNNWVDDEKETYSYQDKDHLTQILTTKWSADLSQWVNDSKVDFSYSLTSGIGNEIAANKKLVVYPNPFTEEISFNASTFKESNFRLYNSHGQLLRTFNRDENLKNINLSYLKSGIYYLKVVSPDSEQVIKLLKAQ